MKVLASRGLVLVLMERAGGVVGVLGHAGSGSSETLSPSILKTACLIGFY